MFDPTRADLRVRDRAEGSGPPGWGVRMRGLEGRWRTGAAILFWVALAALLWLAVAIPMPGGEDGLLATHDKLLHACVYAGLFALGCAGGYSTRAVVLLGVAHGGLVEILQALVPYRMASAGDFAADLAGMALALLLRWGIGRRRGR